MWCWKQVTRVGLLALLLTGASLILVSVSTQPLHAQTSSSLSDPGGITDPGSGPKAGDPDGPTGGAPAPSAPSSRLAPATSTSPGVPLASAVPERRGLPWAQLKVALKLWLRTVVLAF